MTKDEKVLDIVTDTVISGILSLKDANKTIIIDGQNYTITSAKNTNGSIELCLSKVDKEQDQKYIEENVKRLKSVFDENVSNLILSCHKYDNEKYICSYFYEDVITDKNRSTIETKMNEWLKQYSVQLEILDGPKSGCEEIRFTRLA